MMEFNHNKYDILYVLTWTFLNSTQQRAFISLQHSHINIEISSILTQEFAVKKVKILHIKQQIT